MRDIIFALIGISLCESIVLLIVDEDRIGKIVRLIGGTAMTAVLLTAVTEFDFHTYASALQREQSEIQWDADTARENVNLLQRRYIESQCEAYILERASQMRIDISEVVVTLAWNTDGYWYPVHAELQVNCSCTLLSDLKRMIESELGIPIREQVWRGDDLSYEPR